MYSGIHVNGSKLLMHRYISERFADFFIFYVHTRDVKVLRSNQFESDYYVTCARDDKQPKLINRYHRHMVEGQGFRLRL